MAKVMVTGGAGFLGSHLVDKLIEEGHRVAVIDDLSGGSEEYVNPKATFYKADIRDQEAMDRIFKEVKPIKVVHLACDAAENKSLFSPIDISSRLYDGFIKVLVPFIRYGGKRFLLTSSIAVYGTQQTPFREDVLPLPEDNYGILKFACEQTLKIMSEVHGFEYVIARPHNVYGPRQNMRDPYRNVVTIWMNKILKGEALPIYGDGNQIRCFSYIDEVVDALYKCGFLNVSGKTFNIGSSVPYTLNQLAHLIGDEKVVHLPDRAQEVKVAVADHAECKKYLGYKETLLGDGINKTWDWVKEQGPQEPIYTPLELPDSPKIPSNWLK